MPADEAAGFVLLHIRALPVSVISPFSPFRAPIRAGSSFVGDAHREHAPAAPSNMPDAGREW
jgi:hypothetical protein